MRSTRHRILAGVAALSLLGTAAACSAGTTDTAGGAPAATGKTAAAKAKAKKPAVDSCTLLKQDEVEAIIGPNGGGKPADGVGESVCGWENEDNYHSVTVSIGTAGTAPNGKLPDYEQLPGGGPAEAGPDGIRFTSDNTGTFVIANRVCYVQVVTDPTSKKDRNTTVRLVRLIRARTDGKL
ncbi:DUF3558 family protein [Actinoplanes sp. NPDC026619]|uniref:DUF3558 family protein n=1 Tax=Actinoplanes sp. NPDC026619 TaxID=3155798 RepID=UPI0033DF95FB